MDLLLEPRDGTLFDLALEGGAFRAGSGLQTAVILSLFSDRRAGDDDELPDENYRGGWWADGLNEDNHRLGSRLYLLRRSKATPETLRRARFYAEEALAWLVADGIAREVRAIATGAGEVLRLDIEIMLTEGTARSFAFDYRL